MNLVDHIRPLICKLKIALVDKKWLVSSTLFLAACASKPEISPPLPVADLCSHYRSFTYGKEAAAVESLDALRSHVSNEAVFSEKCLAHNSATPGGPR